MYLHGIIGMNLCSHRSGIKESEQRKILFYDYSNSRKLGFFHLGKEALTISNFNKDIMVQELTKSGYLVKKFRSICCGQGLFYKYLQINLSYII